MQAGSADLDRWSRLSPGEIVGCSIHLRRDALFFPPLRATSYELAGGLSLEDHVFKAIALGAPYTKLVCMGRSIMTAAMVGTYEGRKLSSAEVEKILGYRR